MEDHTLNMQHFRRDYQNRPVFSTDDFIVGDRIWINGVKPGYIQYIGETHFAGGDWAGIVLDEPTGKNDGSVGGRKYFYCQPNRGVFCRLDNLTRMPKIDTGTGSNHSTGLRNGSPDSGVYREPSPITHHHSYHRKDYRSTISRSSPIRSTPSPLPVCHRSVSSLSNRDVDYFQRSISPKLIELTSALKRERSKTPERGLLRTTSCSPSGHQTQTAHVTFQSQQSRSTANSTKISSTSTSPQSTTTTTTYKQPLTISRSTSKSPNRLNTSAKTTTTTTTTSLSPNKPSNYMLPRKPFSTITTIKQTTTTLDGPYKAGPLRVGDKVFVNSSKGLLSGRLRYIGKTEFAPGLWAGVHLDEALGKNDGSVAGKRYFHCPKNFGLFAPAYKTVKADPKRMTTVTRVTRENCMPPTV